jgi:hypothetical protein
VNPAYETEGPSVAAVRDLLSTEKKKKKRPEYFFPARL